MSWKRDFKKIATLKELKKDFSKFVRTFTKTKPTDDERERAMLLRSNIKKRLSMHGAPSGSSSWSRSKRHSYNNWLKTSFTAKNDTKYLNLDPKCLSDIEKDALKERGFSMTNHERCLYFRKKYGSKRQQKILRKRVHGVRLAA